MDCNIYSVHFLIMALVLFRLSSSEPIVKLEVGSVRGSEMTSENGNVFFAFRGIPYAEPPAGSLRFKPPVPKKGLGNQPFDATKDGPNCPQFDFFGANFPASEDNCLVVNVYTSDLEVQDGEKRPVMVFIHGGAFVSGSGDSAMYGPKRLIDTGIVLVTINYRLGVYGFLSTGDSASPGNYALLDQIEALKWVKANIEHFGGDSQRVTIFGQSAGGASVHYHTLSPLSKGLFQRAIAMSGTALTLWAFQPNPLIWSQKLATKLGCPVEDTEKLVDCLREVPEKNLTNSATGLITRYLPMIYVPTIDNHFLPDSPENLLQNGRVNKDITFITGVTKDEGIFPAAFVNFTVQKRGVAITKKDLKDQVQDAFGNFPNIEKAVDLVNEKYWSDVDITDQESLLKRISDFYNDYFCDKSYLKTARLMTKNGVQTFAYSFDFEAPYSTTQLLGFKDVMGVAHLDDLFLLFDGYQFSTFQTNDRVKKMQLTFQTLLTNFAKYGHPTPNLTDVIAVEWKPVSSDKIWIYHIDDPFKIDIYDPKDDELYAFWTEKIPNALGLEITSVVQQIKKAFHFFLMLIKL